MTYRITFIESNGTINYKECPNKKDTQKWLDSTLLVPIEKVEKITKKEIRDVTDQFEIQLFADSTEYDEFIDDFIDELSRKKPINFPHKSKVMKCDMIIRELLSDYSAGYYDYYAVYTKLQRLGKKVSNEFEWCNYNTNIKYMSRAVKLSETNLMICAMQAFVFTKMFNTKRG